MSPLSRKGLLLALAISAFAVLALASPVSAELTFCPPGSGAGQCSSPQGVATDFETGRVYVADRNNNRVDVFKAEDGEFLFAFGWGVRDGSPEPQQCGPSATPPSPSCQQGSSGSGAGQFSAPLQIAVDNVEGSTTRHDVYVGTDNFRVQHFEEDGSFVNAFGWGVDTGAKKLETCTTASGCQAGEGSGDGVVNAGECQFSRTNRAIAVGPGGNVFVADAAQLGPEESEGFNSRVEKFSPAGACLGETLLLTSESAVPRIGSVLAVDSSEDAYVVIEGAGGELRKYDLESPETELCSLDPGIGTHALGFDEAGHLFASQNVSPAKGGGTHRVITEYDMACKHVRRFGYGKINGNLDGLAAYHSAEGDVFGSDQGTFGSPARVVYLKTPPPGPIVPPESVEADPIGNTKATIKAEVNPEGKATNYRVDYVDEAGYEADVEGGGNGFEGPATKSTPAKALSIPPGQEFGVRPAEAVIGCPVATEQLIEEGECLEPETAYRFRLVATNADNPTGVGDGAVEGAFTTKPAIEVGDVYATEVGTDAATINADVNPLGIPATGYFEYVEETTFQESGFAKATRIPDTAAGQEPIDFGSAEAVTPRGVSLYPQPPGTTYRYRLIATNPFLETPIVTEEKSFTTFRPQTAEPGECPSNDAFRTGAAALLPDCRAYELVSPLDKANGDIVVQGQIGTSLSAVANQSAVSGDRLTYGSYRAFGDAQSAPFTSQYLAARTAAGWRSHGISPPQGKSIKGAAELDFEFRAFSDDLCQGWIVPLAEPILTPDAIPGYRNLYRRSDRLCGEEGYEAISSAKPQNAKGTNYALELQGRSADGTVAAFAANDSLQGSGAPANPGGKVQLYMKAPEGQPRFACILPGGTPSNQSCSAGTNAKSAFGHSRLANVTGALSEDGQRIFWTASGGGTFYEEGKIYLRENPLGEGAECAGEGTPCTTAVSKAGEEASGASASHFWAAAKDGSRAIFTTGDLGFGKGDLYEYEVEGKATESIAEGVLGILGASEDATRVYFASSEVLTGGEENSEGDKAVEGKANLYLHQAGEGGGSYRFIGTLAGADVIADPNLGQSSATAFEPGYHNGRVSLDGAHAAFMSFAPLTGYDNTDAVSGQPDTEAFLYDAAADEGAGELICVSCNPSGARPAGANLGGKTETFWVAGRIPGFETSLYGSRVLADDGSRLFFESQDALVARDTNGRLDVYQWEEPGAGGCDAGDAGFSAAAGGCVELISSGQSMQDSEFVDASPTGDDVFFTTLSGLVPQDYGLVDIYDARVGGGSAPPPAEDPECEGETCQSPPGAPAFQTPASAGFEGPANLSPAARKPSPRCGEGRRRVSKGGRSRCVKKAKKRKRARSKRGAAR